MTPILAISIIADSVQGVLNSQLLFFKQIKSSVIDANDLDTAGVARGWGWQHLVVYELGNFPLPWFLNRKQIVVVCSQTCLKISIPVCIKINFPLLTPYKLRQVQSIPLVNSLQILFFFFVALI